MLKKILLLSSKQSTKKTKKKRNFSCTNIFFPLHKPKTSSFYQKIYSITPESSNQSKSDNNLNQTNTKKKSISLQNIFKKPKFLCIPYQFKKITNPKLPFSKRIIEPKEIKKEKIKLKKPSRLFHNFETIQWLRKKFSENILSKSIYSLLPNNGKPVVPEDENEEDKRHRKMLEYLDSLKEPIGREKFVSINPKYFFNRNTFELVLKLKKIFLDFDADGNRRMELDEMLEMFESNKIYANINDLVELFFKGKKFKEKEVLQLYLNFYQFINFALTKDQEFRQFMRNIKERSEKDKTDNNKKKIGLTNENDSDSEKDGYLPMSFKSLLDYFVDKGKERDSKEIINKAIEKMNEIINKVMISHKSHYTGINSSKKLNTQKTLKPESLKLNESDISKNINLIKKKTIVGKNSLSPSMSMFKSLIRGIKNGTNTTKKKNNSDDDELEKLYLNLNLDDDFDIDYEKQLKDIDFKKIIEEFSNLFNTNQISSHIKKKNINFNFKSSGSQKTLEKNLANDITQNNDNKEEKSMKKSYSTNFFNSLSTRSQENFKNNLIFQSKGDFSNTFYNPHNNIPLMRVTGGINKKNKFFSARNIDNHKNNEYINLIHNYSRNKTGLSHKKDISKTEKELPKLNNNFNFNDEKKKISGKSVYSRYKLNKRNVDKIKIYDRNIYPISFMTKDENKYNFISNRINNNTKINHKYIINYFGGKINLINNKDNISRSKYDYVPLKLLSNPIHKNKI